MKIPVCAGLLAAAVLAPAWGQPATSPEPVPPSAGKAPRLMAADRLAASLPQPLQSLAREVLERNPDLVRARREAAAAALVAPQVGSLPDPMASLTPFLASPQTRVGPQQLAAGISQRLPWFGKLGLREQAALYGAAAASAQAEARAVALVTEARRIYFDLAFLDAQGQEVRSDRSTLAHYEELARARYASGVGLEQAVVKIQAEITRDDSRLLDIATRRQTLLASLNALRDADQETPAPPLALPAAVASPALAFQALEEQAMQARPEVAQARARIAEAGTRVELAKKEYLPDVTLGLNYTVVGARDDAAGRAMPPEGNGDDAIGLTAGINLPVWRKRLSAGVQEAAERELAAQAGLRSVAADIDRNLGDLLDRIPLTAEQYRLFDRVLTVQAEESLRSAESAYSAGNLGALDLLDAERVLLEVRVSAARALADLEIALARLEGAVATPLDDLAAGKATAPATSPDDAAVTAPTPLATPPAAPAQASASPAPNHRSAS